ncbi:MAG: protoporphyrinogen oxidase [Alphaproteobacteria bacterium]|nr:protoporphyrinogen oxidase [Alphaproteobacteria bacterium]
MKVLIVYATIEGQTAKIARFIREKAEHAGHAVELVDAGEQADPVSFDGADRVILAGSVHERRHPIAFEVFLTVNSAELKQLKTLLISVSLSAAFQDGLEEAQEYVTELEMRTRFSPDVEALVAGAVKSSSYDYFASQVVQHVVLRDRDYTPSEGEHEFTDWGALSKTVSEFLQG